VSSVVTASSAVTSLLELQQQIDQDKRQSLPPPEPLSPAPLKAFLLLRKEAPERYLGQFRQLRGRLMRRRDAEQAAGRPMRSVLVTSPTPGDGKTFVSLNLALMLAVAPGSRVLLADLHPRRPSFEDATGASFPRGVRDVLRGLDWRRAARQVPHMDLFLMGVTPPGAGELDPLDYTALGAWLQRLGADFDWIVLDGPDCAAGPDAELISHLADATVLVVRPGAVRFDLLDSLLDNFDRARLAGVVFNGRA